MLFAFHMYSEVYEYYDIYYGYKMYRLIHIYIYDMNLFSLGNCSFFPIAFDFNMNMYRN